MLAILEIVPDDENCALCASRGRDRGRLGGDELRRPHRAVVRRRAAAGLPRDCRRRSRSARRGAHVARLLDASDRCRSRRGRVQAPLDRRPRRDPAHALPRRATAVPRRGRAAFDSCARGADGQPWLRRDVGRPFPWRIRSRRRGHGDRGDTGIRTASPPQLSSGVEPEAAACRRLGAARPRGRCRARHRHRSARRPRRQAAANRAADPGPCPAASSWAARPFRAAATSGICQAPDVRSVSAFDRDEKPPATLAPVPPAVKATPSGRLAASLTAGRARRGNLGRAFRPS